MKILFIILDGWPTFRPDVAALWGEFLPAEGVRSDVCTLGTTASDQRPAWPAGQAWVCEPGGSKVTELLRSFMHDLRVLWHQRHSDHDAIIVRDKTFIALPALLWARLRGKPLFYWMSFPMAESLARLQASLSPRREPLRWLYLGWRGPIGGWVLRHWVLPKTDHLFVQSQRMAEDLAALGLDTQRMTPVPMCISPARFAQPLPKRARADGRRVIGYLGECSRVRRIEFLFEVTARVRRQHPDVLLLLLGDAYEPADRQWLQDEIARLELHMHVHITGWLPSERVADTFAEVEVALALMAPDPLLDSTTPTKLVEYLAMGRPVVANDHPDQTFVLSESGGGLTAPFDPESFSRKVCQILSDPVGAEKMAHAGRQWVFKHRSYDRAGKSVCTALRKFLC